MVLHGHVRTRGTLGQVFLAPLDCILAQTTIVQPDIVFVDAARRSVISERGIEGAPTLVVEVISPSSGAIDRRRKLQLYARYAVPHYWIVDPPARTIEAHAFAQGRYHEAGVLSGTPPAPLLPFSDLILDPREIWPCVVARQQLRERQLGPIPDGATPPTL